MEPSRVPLCANMTETPSPPSITVEGGERIPFSAQVESQAIAGQTGGVGGSAAGAEELPTPAAPRRSLSPIRRFRRKPSDATSLPSTSAR